MTTNNPNIFSFATNELSQDIFIAWLLHWASPEFKASNPDLHNCGSDVLKLFIGNHANASGSEISKVVTHRQWKNIDIFVKIYFEDGDKLFIIIEDKTYSSEHSKQLERYQEIAQKWAEPRGYRLGCVYFKLGAEQLKVLNGITGKGYSVIGRSEILSCLNNHLHIKDSFVADYIHHLQYLEDGHQAFLILPPTQWKELAWIGLYQYIESQIKINIWHKVNNLSGGFWNLCLTWGYWHDFPLYMQIEQGNICYKLALEAGKKKLTLSEIEVNRIQDFAFNKLISFAKVHNHPIKKPGRYAHKGNFRTFAIVGQEIWLGNDHNPINKEAVIENLKSQISFYDSYMAHLNLCGYVDAGVVTLKETM